MQPDSQNYPNSDDNVRRELDDERQKKNRWRLFALILLGIIILNTRTKQTWWPDLDDGSVMYESSTWWGLNHHIFYCNWQKESDASPDDVKRWCVRHPNGTWHTFIWRYGEDGPADIYYPPQH